MSEFKGTIELIGGITPKNNGDFPLVTAKDIALPDNNRLSDIFTVSDAPSVIDFLPPTAFTTTVIGTQNVYLGTVEVSSVISTWYSNWVRAVVTYDDTVYTCEPKYDSLKNKSIGDGRLINDSVSESSDPFAMTLTDAGYLMISCATSGDHTMSMVLEYNTQYKISDHYIPKSYELVEGNNVLKPGKYHVFGEVDELTVSITESDDKRVNEYCFEFVPSEKFTTLTIDPEPKWVNEPQIVPGKTHQVSIVRGIGVMICA